jgi:hypothetical protein
MPVTPPAPVSDGQLAEWKRLARAIANEAALSPADQQLAEWERFTKAIAKEASLVSPDLVEAAIAIFVLVGEVERLRALIDEYCTA